MQSRAPWLLLCLLLAVCLVLAVLHLTGTVPIGVQTKTLRLALPVSIANPVGQSILDFGRGVEARTGGAVKIELHNKARRYEEQEVISAVSSGAVEMGTTLLGHFAYEAPIAGVFLQPFMFNFDALVRAAAKPGSEIREIIDEEVLYWTNSRVLWWQPYGSTVIFSKGVPAANPSAIVNRNVGTPNDAVNELTRACGGHPHLISASELYAAFEKGTVQAAMTELLSVTERDLWRVTDTITKTQHAPSLFIVVINEKVWQSLSPEHQHILLAAARDAQERIWDRFSTIEAEAYVFAAQKGMKVYELSPEDVVAWRACSSPLLESYMERVGDLGPKLFAAYGRLRTQPCCSHALGQQPFGYR